MFAKIIKISILFVLLASVFSCGTQNTRKNSVAEIKKGVAPVADSEVAVVEMEQPIYGKFTIELYSNIVPEMVKRFKELAREGFYNGTTFHRIDNALGVVQGGDPLTKDDNPENDGAGGSDKPNVKAEFSDIPFDTGIVGAARGQDNDSANSQFFIMTKRQPNFDGRYTIFGKVIDGMNNVRIISGVPRDGTRPLDDVRIKSITIEPKQ
ncbi:MAG: peptidylprolyl isomerase [Pyrinomonadaceae bacterium]